LPHLYDVRLAVPDGQEKGKLLLVEALVVHVIKLFFFVT
jgi:hypothetical protein